MKFLSFETGVIIKGTLDTSNLNALNPTRRHIQLWTVTSVVDNRNSLEWVF